MFAQVKVTRTGYEKQLSPKSLAWCLENTILDAVLPKDTEPHVIPLESSIVHCDEKQFFSGQR